MSWSEKSPLAAQLMASWNTSSVAREFGSLHTAESSNYDMSGDCDCQWLFLAIHYSLSTTKPKRDLAWE